MFGNFFEGLGRTLEKQSRRSKFQNPLQLPPAKDNRLPPRTSKKPKRRKPQVSNKVVELSRTDLPSSNKSASVEKNNSVKLFSSVQGSNQSKSPRSPSPINQGDLSPASEHNFQEDDMHIRDNFLKRVPLEIMKSANKPYLSTSPEKNPKIEITVERVCLGELLNPKFDNSLSKESAFIPLDCTPFKESEPQEMGAHSEVEYLFEGVHRNLFPKMRAPIEAKILLEDKSIVPRCYKLLLDTFIHLELALFYLASKNQRLTYKKIKETIFNQTKR